MTKNKSKWEPLLYSGLGVVGMFLILLAIAAIGNSLKVRLDLTEEKLYTLSDGTRKVLSKIDSPVTIRFYCTQSQNDMPVFLKNYAKRVEDLLSEYRQASKGKITILKFDPKPDTEAEDSARLDGVEGRSLSSGGLINLEDKIYLGLAVACLDAKETIPFLDPSREKLLEYDLTRAISKVISNTSRQVGVMSGLPVFGQPGMNPMMGSRGTPPWLFIQELRRDFQVREVSTSVESIDEDLDVLVLIHPTKLSDKTLYALDQFVLRGGKLVAFLDPLSIADSRGAMNMQMMMQRTGSTLGKLLTTWGLNFDINKVLADKTFMTRISRGQGQSAQEPTWLTLTSEGINRDDVVTADIDQLLLPAPGVFTGTPAEGLSQDILLHSSKNSDLMDRTMVQFGANINNDFKPSGKVFTLALRLRGKFKTAFPDGPPKDDTSADANKDKKDAKDTAKPDSLKESEKEGVVVLVGDSDMLYDHFCFRIQNFLGQQLVSPLFGNLAFAQNVIEQLLGDNDLISVRSRAVKSRPFTVVRDMQAQAEEKYLARIRQLQQDVKDAQARIDELTRHAGQKDDQQRFILPPEAEKEIADLRVKIATANKELRQVRRDLRRDVDALETKIKWLNIAGMPLLVALVGLGLAIANRKKTAAK